MTGPGSTPESAAILRASFLAAMLGAKPSTCPRHPQTVPSEFFEGCEPRQCPACGKRVPEGWDAVDEQAIKLARETLFTYQEWLVALTRIRRRPDGATLIPTVRDLACASRAKPDTIALSLVGDGLFPGLLDALAGERQQQP